MSLRIDINCDLGEGGVHDAELLELVTSANIACGRHAGDASTMRRTVELAAAKDVAIGAHPGLPDAANMGRSASRVTPQEAFDLVAHQVGAIAGIALACGQRLAHVKPHGTLYNQAATDDALAEAIAHAVRAVDDKLILFGLAGSRLVAAGRAAGLKVAQEAFADRAYQADGTLLPRGRAGAVLGDPQQCAQQALRLVKERQAQAVDGTVVHVQADTLCVHGDSPGAAETLRQLRHAFSREGVEVLKVFSRGHPGPQGRSMSEAFEVTRAGVMASVQDLGRWGYQKFGMSASGAMDAFALRAGNALVGNQPTAAAVEVAMGHLALRVLEDRVVAICGADLEARLDGREAPRWRSFLVRRGQELSWGRPVAGMWAYLCVSGGIDVPKVLGSRSTFMRARIGGCAGRALAKGNFLRTSPAALPARRFSERVFPPDITPAYTHPATVRTIRGPQAEAFTDEALQTLFSSQYTLTPQCDRMGYRLSGPILSHRTVADIISDALTFGSIQVPPDGQPIVLMADRQTVGGYAKIGTVISTDLPRLAQLRPGQAVRFQEVSVEQGQDELSRQEHVFHGLSWS